MCSYYNSYFFKKDCSYWNNCGVRLHDSNLEHSLIKEKKNRCSYVLLPIFVFSYSRFSLRNLKDANSYMFSWCITTNSLLICSWKMTFIQYCSWHDKCTEFAVNLYYFQVLALYKKVVERNQSWWKCFLYWWFSFDLYLILGALCEPKIK